MQTAFTLPMQSFRLNENQYAADFAPNFAGLNPLIRGRIGQLAL
jgi:hypothetical protein